MRHKKQRCRVLPCLACVATFLASALVVVFSNEWLSPSLLQSTLSPWLNSTFMHQVQLRYAIAASSSSEPPASASASLFFSPSATPAPTQSSSSPPPPPQTPAPTHSPTAVSAPNLEHARGKVIIGIFTSKLPAYRAKLEAQMETWAAPLIPDGRYIAIAGAGYPEKWVIDGVVKQTECADAMNGISCKEGHLIAEAAARGASWILIAGEDQYVNMNLLERSLKKHDADAKPLAFGCVGCGKGLHSFCKTVDELGGFCGGCAYALNNATLQHINKKGAKALIKKYSKYRWPNDMTTSCVLREAGIDLANLDGLTGFPIWSKKDYINHMKGHLLTLHYIQPAVQYFLYALEKQMESKNDETTRAVELASKAAFANGKCAHGMDKPMWRTQYDQCMKR